MAQCPPQQMQAWVCAGYGDATQLQLQSRPIPTPGPEEILLRVCASTVSSADVRIRRAQFPAGMGLMGRLIFGWRRPRQGILGTDVTGVVEQLGQRVSAFKPGDEVVAMTGFRMGAHAQYCTISASHCVALKPAELSFTEAIALPFGGLTAMHFLREAALQPGERLLVIGGAGAVGNAVIQLARPAGAVISSLTSRQNQPLMLQLGVSQALDYSSQDILTMGQQFDVIVDTVARYNFNRSIPLLAAKGRYIAIAGGLPELFSRSKNGKKCIAGPAQERPQDLEQLLQRAVQGDIRPLIDKVYQADDLPEAHRYAETGRKRGALVVRW